MSIEFEELEEPLSVLGSMIVAIASFILLLLGSMGFTILGGNEIQYISCITPTHCETIRYSNLSIGYSFFFIFMASLIILLFAILSIARNKIKFKVNVFVAAVFELILFISLIMSVPGPPVQPEVTSSMVAFIWIGIGGIAIIFLSKRPNLGKESNKHLYQAYGGVLNFLIGLILIILGAYIIIFDIGAFAGNGTFPDAFDQAYLLNVPSITATYGIIRLTGTIIIIGGVILMILSVIRNLITLYFSSIIMFGGIITVAVGVILFFQNWVILDSLFSKNYPLEYDAQLRLQDPLIVNLGVVLILLSIIGVLMIIYAAQQSEPLDKWKQKRNTMLAAAEVSIRDQKLQKAIKYLEEASIWSSKLGEEDRAVELITRINSIKEKAIKMRKAQAADKKKAELDAAKKKAEARAPKAPPGKE